MSLLLKNCTMRNHVLRPCSQSCGLVEEMEKKEVVDNNYCKDEEEEEEAMKSSSSSIIVHHNEDIMTEILNRVVPPQSLYANMRYVSKQWFNIITSTFFQQNHPLSKEPPCLIIQKSNYFAYYLRTSGYIPEDEANILIDQAKTLGCCVPQVVGQQGMIRICDIISVLDALKAADPFTTYSIQVGQEGILQQVDLVADSGFSNKLLIRACCNGLMIARPRGSPYDTLYLLNFITKQSVRLPPPRYLVLPLSSSLPIVGFTFVPSTGEYKVVLHHDTAEELRCSKKRKRNEMSSNYSIQVLTFGGSGTGASSSYDDLHWKVVQAPRLDSGADPIAVDGVLYWERPQIDNRNVICFDAKEERFYIISSPGDDPFAQADQEGLLELAGYLGYYIYSHIHRQLDFWILKNFRTGGEWIKHSSMIIADQDTARLIYQSSLMPELSYGLNGEVIIFENLTQGNLWAYNMKSSMWWKMGSNINLVHGAGDTIGFFGFHVNKFLPLNSLLIGEQKPV